MLTARQKQALDFVDEYIRTTGRPPSYAEMLAALRLKSKGNMTRILDCLVERGHVSRVKHKERTVRVLQPSVARVPLTHPGPEAEFYVVAKNGGDDARLVPLQRKDSG